MSLAKDLYPTYRATAALLAELNIAEDFQSENNTIRYGHRNTGEMDIYFVANRTDEFQKTTCRFRAHGEPELWMATSGETRKITNYRIENGLTVIEMEFYPHESFFITFSGADEILSETENKNNFPVFAEKITIAGDWDLSFDPKFGGPENIRFKILQDWTAHENRGIKYYSGIASYRNTFEIENVSEESYYIDLGEVNDIARVRLNGKDIGIIWCAPWRINISDAIRIGENKLEIEVANRWINRLLGDRQEPDAHVRKVKFDNGLMGGIEYSTGRYTFTTKQAMGSFKFTEPLPSGLLGPVRILTTNYE